MSTAICATFAASALALAASALALAAPTLALAAAASAALASITICTTFAASTLALATPTLALAAASAGGSERDTASSSTGGAECDGVSAFSAARESVAADNAFRLVLDASPDGLPVLGWQRLPRCEQQRVLPGGRVEPRRLWREQPQHAHVCGLHVARNN